MRRAPLITLSLVAVVLVGWLGWRAANAWYVQPRRSLSEDVADMGRRLASRETALRDAPRVEREIRAWADRTLGADLEAVDHRLRARLNRIVEAAGVASASVGTGPGRAVGTPARRQVPARLRDETDLVEVEAWITAEGTGPQIVELIDRVDAEPWAKRLDQVKLTPKRDGVTFGMTLRLTTMYLPGLEPASTAAAAYDPARLARLADLIELSRFRVPPPEVAVADAASETPGEPEPDAAPDVPWNEWMLTGIAERSGGSEAWLRNTRSGETLTLVVGEGWNQVVLRDADGESAEFERAGRRFRLTVGEHFGAHLPADGG